jgi:iron complex transport system ATP-binding protein
MLRLDGVRYSIDDKQILTGISGRFEEGKIHGIVGPNGSGKSTLLKNICRIWVPEEGRVLIRERDIRDFSRRELSRTVTLVPQNTSVGFPISVYELVTMGRNPHLGRFQPLRRKDREIIDWALQETHSQGLKDRIVNELSGGECQLATIARALATEAPLILLDEPTSDLDIKHALTILNLLADLKAKGKTFVVTLHDLNLARRYCDTLSILYRGGVFFTGPPDKALSRENIKQVFDVDATEIRSDSKSFLYFH